MRFFQQDFSSENFLQSAGGAGLVVDPAAGADEIRGAGKGGGVKIFLRTTPESYSFGSLKASRKSFASSRRRLNFSRNLSRGLAIFQFQDFRACHCEEVAAATDAAIPWRFAAMPRFRSLSRVKRGIPRINDGPFQ